MKTLSVKVGYSLVISMLFLALILISCKKEESAIKYPKGTFPPDTAISITDMNSAYDDFAGSSNQVLNEMVLLISSSRGSSGSQLDLLQGEMLYVWDQNTGIFDYSSGTTSDAFLTSLINAANTSRNDFAPFRTFCADDGYEYLLLTSENAEGNTDLYYLRNIPSFNSNLPTVHGPYPATLLNSEYDDEDLCFDVTQDSAYFSSNRSGDFDIYLADPCEYGFAIFFDGEYPSTIREVDSLNSSENDKCPSVFKKIMVFASDRAGGIGNFDLYYSIFRNGKWSSPENFGPKINSASNEYRPLLLSNTDFTNYILLFSSDRPGGQGGYDLYFSGVTISLE